MLVFWIYFLQFLALAEKVPQSLTHTCGGLFVCFFCFFFYCGSLSLISLVLYICYGHCHSSGTERDLHRHKHKRRLDTNPETTVMLNKMCTCTSRLVGLKRTDVIPTARPLHHHGITLSHVVSRCHASLPLSNHT